MFNQLENTSFGALGDNVYKVNIEKGSLLLNNKS